LCECDGEFITINIAVVFKAKHTAYLVVIVAKDVSFDSHFALPVGKHIADVMKCPFDAVFKQPEVGNDFVAHGDLEGCLNASHPAVAELFHILDTALFVGDECAESRFDEELFFLVVLIGCASAKECLDETSVVEMFFWIGEDGSVRNKQRISHTCDWCLEMEVGGFEGFDCFAVLFDDDFDPFGEVLVADEKFSEKVALITATRGVACYSRFEAEDTGVEGVLTETLQKNTGRLGCETSSGENGGSNSGKHRRVVGGCLD